MTIAAIWRKKSDEKAKNDDIRAPRGLSFRWCGAKYAVRENPDCGLRPILLKEL